MRITAQLSEDWKALFATVDEDNIEDVQGALGVMSVVLGPCGSMLPEDLRTAAPDIVAALRRAEQRLTA